MLSTISTVIVFTFSFLSVIIFAPFLSVVSADGGFTDVKIVEGVEKVSGTGHDMTLAYSYPDPFQG